MPLKPLTYADSASIPQPHNTQEKTLPRRGLNEVLVKVIEDPQPNQTSGKLVVSINTAHPSKAGKVLAAWRLGGEDFVITANSHKTKNLIEQEEE
jgi:hypothetical protein